MDSKTKMEEDAAEELQVSVSFLSFSSTETSSSLKPASPSLSEIEETPVDSQEIQKLLKHAKKRSSLPNIPQCRLLQCPTVKGEFPRSYHENNLKETVLMDYFCQKLTERISRKVPRRKPPPLLVLPNEVGIPKMVCTTINISKIPFGLETFQDIAHFLSQHITYIPLAKPTEYPTELRSPNTVFASQRANCLEFSNLLVSLLCGISVDNAYVVFGYATRQLCENDQSSKPCPVSINMPRDSEAAIVRLDNKESDPYLIDLPEGTTYKFDADKNRDYESKTDKNKRQVKLDMKEMKKKEMELKRRNRKEQAERRPAIPPDPFRGQRIHSWVLVFENYNSSQSSTQHKLLKKPNSITRDKQKPLCVPYFIEPSTGERHEINDENYLGIESVWNHSNYWFNRQHHLIDSSNMTFNLNKRRAWKRLLHVKMPHTTLDSYSKRESHKLSTHESSSKSKSNPKKQYFEGTVVEVARPEPAVKFMMPFTWTESVTLDRCRYLNRNYGGRISKRTKYYKTVLDQFQELSHPEGLVTKIIYFIDDEYKLLHEVLDEYKFRTDKLKYRRRNYTEKTVQEYFDKGRSDAVKTYSSKNMNGQHEYRVEFYSESRPDRMKSLFIKCNYKTHVMFENRKDFLKEVYGETMLELAAQRKERSQPEPKENDEQFTDQMINATSHAFDPSTKTVCPKLKKPYVSKDKDRSIGFAQVIYNRNPEKLCDDDLQKAVFFPSLDHIEATYHSEETDMTHKRITVTKTRISDNRDLHKYVKFYPRDPYELNKLEHVECCSIIGKFKELANEVLLKLNQSETLMKAIYNDRTSIRSRQELLPQNKIEALRPLLKVEEDVEATMKDYQALLCETLKKIK